MHLSQRDSSVRTSKSVKSFTTLQIAVQVINACKHFNILQHLDIGSRAIIIASLIPRLSFFSMKNKLQKYREKKNACTLNCMGIHSFLLPSICISFNFCTAISKSKSRVFARSYSVNTV